MLIVVIAILKAFQLTAARRRLEPLLPKWIAFPKFQLTAARRRLGGVVFTPPPATWRFNSQPPEGGWILVINDV